MIMSRKIDQRLRKGIVLFHLTLLIFYFLSLIFFKPESGFVFMIFFCFGVAAAGLITRSNSKLILKLYYSIFLLSILIFLYSPSLFISLLVQQKIPERKGNEFLLTENYFLVKQQSMLDIPGGKTKYKIIRRTGNFNKTLERDIPFHAMLDSAVMIRFENDTMLVRGYFKTGMLPDSLDVSSDLKIENTDEIILKRK